MVVFNAGTCWYVCNTNNPHFFKHIKTLKPYPVKAEIKIGGMTCVMCVGAIEKTLGQLRGVESVTVNLGSEQTYGKNCKNGVRFMEFVKFKDLTPYFPRSVGLDRTSPVKDLSRSL